MPDLTFGQFAGGGETGNFSTGSGATGRAVVCGAGAKDKVLGIGIDAGFGGGKAFDVIDFSAIFASDVLGVQGVTNSPGEIGKSSDIFGPNFRPLVGDEEEPIATPCDVSSDFSTVGQGHSNVFCEAITWDVFDCD